MKKKFWLGIAILFLAACSQTVSPTTRAASAVPVLLPTKMTPAPFPSEPAIDPTQEPTQPCGYQWARMPLPEVSQQFQNIFDEAGLPEIILRAEAFGENCLNSDLSVQRFLPMQTDLYLMIPVSDLQPETIGTWLEKVLTILEQGSLISLPGPMSASAYITLEFSANSEKLTLRLQRPQVFQPLDEGKHGLELYRTLVP
jgi:hypothetical protein